MRIRAGKFFREFLPDAGLACAICDTRCGVLQPVCVESGGEHYNKGNTCKCFYCGECLARWITSALDDGGEVRCPTESCAFKLFADDIKRLGTDDDLAKYTALRTRQCGDRLEEALADKSLAKWISENTRACPRCQVIIERSQGCNSMLCTCGERFNWATTAGISRA